MPDSQLYRRECINNPSCAEAERTTAIYDYVGAVYGGATGTKYDGRLTPPERDAVIQKWGELKAGKGESFSAAIEGYIRKAREDYLATLKMPHNDAGQCEKPFQFQQFRNSTLGWAMFVGGYHDCALEFGAIYYRLGVELEVAAHPEEWVFIIEGYQNVHHDRMAESALFERIAGAFQTPIPIINAQKQSVLGNGVVSAAAKKFGHARIVYQIVLLGQALGTRISKQAPSTRWEKIIEDVARRLAGQETEVHLMLEAFYDRLSLMSDEKRSDILARVARDSDFLLGRFSPMTERWFELLNVSNEINVAPIREELAKHPTKKRHFFQAGIDHFDLAKNLYGQNNP